MDYKETIKDALFQEEYEEVNVLLNKAIKDDTVLSEYYDKLCGMCRRAGFVFAIHFNLITKYEENLNQNQITNQAVGL